MSIFSQTSNATDPELTVEKQHTTTVQQQHQLKQQEQHLNIDVTDISKSETNLSSGQLTSTNIVIPKKTPAIVDANDFHYESVDNVKLKYNYHDEPHSFETSMEFQDDYNHFNYEVLETTV